MTEPEVTYSIEPRTEYYIKRDGVVVWPWAASGVGAYSLASTMAAAQRDARGYPPGDDRIQWPAIPPGVYIPPVPAPEAA